ncbi:hypothetical protein E4U40_007923 [Claviceps sp. LM458 group G5]|nr:hypothetical protein E4U40_007923 [Claviceps sp. LM458 group G5]
MSTPSESDRSELDLNKLTDDMSLRKRGSSFVDHRDNANVKKMRCDGKRHPLLARESLRQVDKFRKLLLFCVHVTGGQPARGLPPFLPPCASDCSLAFLPFEYPTYSARKRCHD